MISLLLFEHFLKPLLTPCRVGYPSVSETHPSKNLHLSQGSDIRVIPKKLDKTR